MSEIGTMHRNLCAGIFEEIKQVFINEPASALKKRLAGIVASNYAIDKGGSHLGFRYRNREFYSSVQPTRIVVLRPLHPDLHPQMEFYLKLDATCSRRAVRAQQILWPAMIDAGTIAGVRNVVPEGLAQVVPSLSRLPRTAPEGLAPTTLWIKQREYEEFQNLVHDFVAEQFLN